ncbi:hypothetical protein HN873_070235, partial [Arachis hypogaea]
SVTLIKMKGYAKVKILKHNIVISVCCDDRPELFSELIQVLKGLRLINQDQNIFRSSKQLTEAAKHTQNKKHQKIRIQNQEGSIEQASSQNLRKSKSKIKKAA